MRQIDLPSPNHGPRPEGVGVELLVLHYTGMPTAADALARLTDPASNVSAHYTVDEDGSVYVHVAEERRAWHAGVSRWRDRDDVNSRSIGVEIVNPGHEFGYRLFPVAQMEAVAALSADVLKRHGLSPADVVAHSDIAPARKQDPGELFDWPWLAGRGIGLWPAPDAEDWGSFTVDEVTGLLARIGYDVSCPQALSAFQRRYRPAAIDGTADRDTVARMRALARMLPSVGNG